MDLCAVQHIIHTHTEACCSLFGILKRTWAVLPGREQRLRALGTGQSEPRLRCQIPCHIRALASACHRSEDLSRSGPDPCDVTRTFAAVANSQMSNVSCGHCRVRCACGQEQDMTVNEIGNTPSKETGFTLYLRSANAKNQNR
jgi:hypothetical protein